jgi:hypothetical protein
MFHKKSSFVPFLLAGFLGVCAANAQAQSCPYRNASLQGNYAIIGNYTGRIALAMGWSISMDKAI